MLWILCLLVFFFWWDHNERMDETERRRQAEADARYWTDRPWLERYGIGNYATPTEHKFPSNDERRRYIGSSLYAAGLFEGGWSKKD